MSGFTSLCSLCSIFSLIGGLFYLCMAAMVYNRNPVFLFHKAGMNPFSSKDAPTEAQYEEKLWVMLNTAITFAIAMAICFITSICSGYCDKTKAAQAEFETREAHRHAF